MKKLFISVILLSIINFFSAQSLPIDFESGLVVTSTFVDFDGGTASVIANPQSSGINVSSKVAKIVRNGGATWAGSKVILSSNLDFSTNSVIGMKVYTSAPVGTTIKFKLEGGGNTERDVQTTVSNAWEELKWDFTGEPSNFNTLVFMFDFGNVGDGSANSTFLFDDIQQIYAGSQLDLPVTFEDNNVNYTTTDFGGNISQMVVDPMNANNKVIEVVKTTSAATWAGTTIGTPAGFTTNIPLTLSSSIMTVRVWSPEAGTPIRLKVEDSNDPTHTCETETNTTIGGGWETITFDFSNQAPGTELLSIGLGFGWTYNMASIFFNFGTEGIVAGEKTYYFDDVWFGFPPSNPNSIEECIWNENKNYISIFPNPTKENITINTPHCSGKVETQVFDLLGNNVINSSSRSLSLGLLKSGVFILRTKCGDKISELKVIKE
ncbi:MAG: T9SS type A sorting domain-containing protein [Flavobacteriales bacterium]|nr:T9SS type A sorting domain-containing protein [Flavobacteriales bacterium]